MPPPRTAPRLGAAAAERELLASVPGLHVGDADIGDGHYIHYTRTAEGKPPLVLLHGWMSALGLWHPAMVRLAEHYTVYAVDLLGWGMSSRPGFAGPDAEAVRRWWVASLDAWRAAAGPAEPFVLVGHSLGGWVAGQYALAHPRWVRRVVLAAAVGVHPADATFFASAGPFLDITRRVCGQNWPMRLARLVLPAARAARAAREYAPNGTDEEAAYIRAYLTDPRGSGEVAAEFLRVGGGAALLWPRLGEVEVPVTLIHAEGDAQVHPAWCGAEVLAQLRHATVDVFVIEGAGHDAPLRSDPAIAGPFACAVRHADSPAPVGLYKTHLHKPAGLEYAAAPSR